MPTPCVPYDTLILPLRRDSTCCTRRCSLISRYEMNSSINTPFRWGFDIMSHRSRGVLFVLSLRKKAPSLGVAHCGARFHMFLEVLS